MEQNEITERALSLPDQARKIVIVTVEDRKQAGQLLKEVVALQKEIETKLGPGKAAAWKSYKIAKKTMDDLEAQAKTAENILKPMIAEFDTRQERERIERERKLQAEEDARRVAEADAAEARGDFEAAREIMEEPAVPIIVPIQKVKDGVSSYTTWKFRVVNEALVPREYLMLDLPKIGAIVKGLKDKTVIAGIEPYPDTIVSVRTE
ncbi:hypothetical protein EHM76_00545 [bacterium]|nr:MAG: hypothetical protein EHM76_00545 [bacterium]